MKVEFVKWGNSLALRVPKAFAEEVGAYEGKRAEMTAENGRLVVRVAKPNRRRRYDVRQLIDGITQQNRHAAAEWWPPVGGEVW